MEWIHRSPQLHSIFGNLGYIHGDGYYIHEYCNGALGTILKNILTEDKYLTFRRSISFGQNVPKDIIPLLIHAKDDNTIELLIQILVNLTIPKECLLSVDVLSKTDYGRHTIFEITNLLTSSKVSFTDHRVTKVVIDFLKKNIDFKQADKLTLEQCANIGSGLLLLRNILHIPEVASTLNNSHTVQNQIMWHIFSQSFDKILIKLITIPEATNWSVTIVQLIALLYKDQHVVTLHKLLNVWLETSLSESSEDNESNTSMPDRDCEDSSPMLTSDPTSDSSDTCAVVCKSDGTPQNTEDKNWVVPSPMEQYPESPASSMTKGSTVSSQSSSILPSLSKPVLPPKKFSSAEKSNQTTDPCVLKRKHLDSKSSSGFEEGQSETSSQAQFSIEEKNIAFTSDCGYGTQVENQESVSTSSNEDEPNKKPVHHKPHNPKQKPNTKVRIHCIQQDRKRKKVVKRARATVINVQGLSRNTPTDDDISNILKEFTVDFLLKGYNALVRTLHSQILTDLHLEIDSSHFFWLVTYFLKFASQIELDLEYISSVLSYDIVSYLTAEGVNLCEQFELSVKLDGADLKPSMRRLHLVVTAIREFVQTIEAYKKLSQFSSKHTASLTQLQIKVSEMEELKLLMVLLLRHYNPKHHSKQYLQDLVVTNHILLSFVDSVLKMPDYKGTNNIVDHIRQFATPEMMYQYGQLLQHYAENGEFVNDCIFTLMHHIGGELGNLISLFQPIILKTFTSIWKSDYEICDDWSDLIEYVINTFVKKPHSLQSFLDTDNIDNIDDEDLFTKPTSVLNNRADSHDANRDAGLDSCSVLSDQEIWTESELSSLSWNFIHWNTSKDVIGDIVSLFKEDGITKSRHSVIRELYKQKIINKENLDNYLQNESELRSKLEGLPTKEARDEEIKKICALLIQDEKLKFLEWLQKVLLDTCLAKIYVEKKTANAFIDSMRSDGEKKMLNFEAFKRNDDMPLLSPVAYHSLLLNKSEPLVPWNSEQAAICRDLKFLRLLHKLGLHMPVDTGKLFIRVPHFWTADYLYEVAGKILPIVGKKDVSKMDLDVIATKDNLYYQVQEQSHHATSVKYTPKPELTFDTASSASVDEEPAAGTWLDLVQRSRELKLAHNTDQREQWMPPPLPPLGVATTTSSTTLAPRVMSAALAPPVPLPPLFCDTVNNHGYSGTASSLKRFYKSGEGDGTKCRNIGKRAKVQFATPSNLFVRPLTDLKTIISLPN